MRTAGFGPPFFFGAALGEWHTRCRLPIKLKVTYEG